MNNVIVAVALFALPVVADQKVSRNALPSAVAAVADKESQGATLKGYSREVENGQTYYEVETIRNGKTRDVLIDRNGSVVEIEEEVAMSSLPEAVQKGLQSVAGAARVTKIESVTKGGTTTYEAAIRNGARKSEIKVDAQGKVVK